MKKVKIAAVVFGLFLLGAVVQAATLNVNVYRDGNPVPRAKVLIVNDAGETIANGEAVNGTVAFADIPEGIYQFMADDNLGFGKKTDEVKYDENGVCDVDIELSDKGIVAAGPAQSSTVIPSQTPAAPATPPYSPYAPGATPYRGIGWFAAAAGIGGLVAGVVALATADEKSKF